MKKIKTFKDKYNLYINTNNFMIIFGFSSILLLDLNKKASFLCTIIFLLIGFFDTFKIKKSIF